MLGKRFFPLSALLYWTEKDRILPLHSRVVSLMETRGKAPLLMPSTKYDEKTAHEEERAVFRFFFLFYFW